MAVEAVQREPVFEVISLFISEFTGKISNFLDIITYRALQSST
jgi:hypothetical protein